MPNAPSGKTQTQRTSPACCNFTRGFWASVDSVKRQSLILACIPRDIAEQILGIICCPAVCVCTSCIDVEKKDEEWRTEERAQYDQDEDPP